jgi:hypothetical protein
MLAAAEVHRQSLLLFLLKVGGGAGIGLVALGGLLTLWGLINLGFVKRRGALVSQALLSFLPISLAFVGMCVSAFRLLDMATAPRSTRPEVVADTMAFALILGLFGSASTVVPALLGIVALARNLRATEEDRVRAKNVSGGV